MYRIQNFKIFIFFAYYFAIRNSNNFKTYIQTFYERCWLDIRVRTVPLRSHKFVTLAVNGSSWITNTATFAGSTDVFANFHAEIARSAISRAFKLSRELTVTNGVLHGARSISVFEREIYLVAGKNRIIQHPCYVMNYSDRSRYSINYYRSYLDLYFHWQAVRHVFFKLTESRAAAESPPHKRAQRAEANPGQLQACSNWIPIWEDTGIPGITNDCFR